MSSGIPINPSFEAKEVLLARITFPEQEEKLRPILVISKFSSRAFIPSSSILVCLAITSNRNTDPFMIPISNTDMEVKPLPIPSHVVCNHFFTILKTDVIKRIGKVKPDFYDKVTQFVRSNVLDI